MTTSDTAPDTRADDLVREIEAQSEAECRALLDAARLEAQAIVREAAAAATRHVHDAMEDLKRDGARRLARAKAQIDTEMRVRDQALAAGNLRDGCPMLVVAVAERWNDAAARRSWAIALARQAFERLRPGNWVVEHPKDWAEDEAGAFLEALPAEARGGVRFRAVDDFEAGLRVVAPGVVLDATPERLLADKPAVQALLLAGIARERAAASATAGDTP
ncbi:hypothetical protein [Pinisolibacter sp.]|uniref:hypothetical protein n=1 Tax=Pinisolibacter sp. TaxID=2172024 RepID=UPI002FDEA678